MVNTRDYIRSHRERLAGIEETIPTLNIIIKDLIRKMVNTENEMLDIIEVLTNRKEALTKKVFDL